MRWYDTPENRKKALKYKKEYERKNPNKYVELSLFKILPASKRMIGALFGSRRRVKGPMTGNPGVFEKTWPKSYTEGAVAWTPSEYWKRKGAGYSRRLK